MKFTALLLLLVPVAASAQYNYDYTSGPIYSASSNTPMLPLPSLGSDITGIVTLSQELPATGTVTVTPLDTNFLIGGVLGIGEQGPGLGNSFTFTTQNGILTSFSFDQINVPVIDLQASSTSNEVTFFTIYPNSPLLQLNVEGTAGSFSGPGLNRAPEIDPSGAGSALTLFVGILALVRGRRISRGAPATR
ncbi:MAG TPA: hypothetical protein VHY19_07130 [Steroidobacteraceae bacterium]|jgi:hypothetical protein|nr:hypothetical protein [Steroidobacteraceae bacterium]